MDEKSNLPEKEPIAGDVRGQLIKRLAVAAGMVAILLGVLAVFDRLSSSSDDSDDQVFTRPVPVPPKKEVTQPVVPAANLPDPPAPPPPPQVVSEPVPALPRAEQATDVPNVRLEKKADGGQEIRPPARSTATDHALPVAPVAERGARQQPVQGTQRAPGGIAEATSAPRISPEPAPAEGIVAAKPTARIAELRNPPTPAPPVGAQRLFSGFLLQAGVFSSAQRAEELHARLTLSGVPSTLETRVQVGPFRTRQEAEAAQEKLRQLGVDSMLVPAKGGKN